MSSISALYVSDQTRRPVVASVNWTPTRTRLPLRRMLPSSRYRAFKRRPISEGARFEPLNRKLEDFEITIRFEKRPSAAMTSSVIPSLKKS